LLAPKGIPIVLTLEIACGWSTADSGGRAAVDRDDRRGESDVGLGTDCRRAPRQARHSRLSADRATVHAVATTVQETRKAGVEFFLRAEPHTIGARQRFLCRWNGYLSGDLRVCRSGSWDATNPALERDRASDSGLERAAVSDDCARRSGAPIRIHDRDTIYSEAVDRTLEKRVWRFSRRRPACHKRRPSASA
jgi:hypothetical protein